MMSAAELDELAADIEANGLQEPIALWRDNREEPASTTGPATTTSSSITFRTRTGD
jgi:hypothetical protein